MTSHRARRHGRVRRLIAWARARGYVLVATGFLIGILAIIGSLLALSAATRDTQRLTQTEIAKVRELIADRGEYRNAEQERRDRVLCTTLGVLAESTTQKTERAQLVAAARELDCAALPSAVKATPTPSPTATRDSDDTTSTTSRTTAPAPAVRPSSSSRPPVTSKPRPTPAPTPRPTPTSNGGGVVDDLTDTVCGLTGICL